MRHSFVQGMNAVLNFGRKAGSVHRSVIEYFVWNLNRSLILISVGTTDIQKFVKTSNKFFYMILCRIFSRIYVQKSREGSG